MGIIFLAIIFFFSVVFLVLFLSFKKIRADKNPLSNLKFWIGVVLLTPLVAIGSLYAYLYFSSRYEDKSFESTIWIEDEDNRYLYVNDLVKNELLLSKNRSEIIEKLGEPSIHEDHAFHYTIGYDPKQYFNMTPDWLILEFENDKVDTFYIQR